MTSVSIPKKQPERRCPALYASCRVWGAMGAAQGAGIRLGKAVVSGC